MMWSRKVSFVSVVLAGSLLLTSCTVGGDNRNDKIKEQEKPDAPVPTLNLPKNVEGKKSDKWGFKEDFKISVEQGTLEDVHIYPTKKAEKDRDKKEKNDEKSNSDSTIEPSESTPSSSSPESSPSSNSSTTDNETAVAGGKISPSAKSVEKSMETESADNSVSNDSSMNNSTDSPSSSSTTEAKEKDTVDFETFETKENVSEGIDEKFFLDGEMSDDETSWKREKKELNPNTGYTWFVSTVDGDGEKRFYSGDVKTRKLKDSEKGGFRSNIGDDQTVGVAAPIIITFNTKVDEKYRDDVEKKLDVKVKDKKVKGSWGWLYDDMGGSRLHYRTKDYWPAHSKVSANIDLNNVKLNSDTWSTQKMSIDFKIGRKQEVVADAKTHQMNVFKDGKKTMSFPTSLGSAKAPSYNGTHVVMSKHRHYTMTSERWGYSTPTEYSVRIHNNGEFIHAAPWSVGSQGVANVSHGCINLSTARAQQYYNSAIYGDPVKVKGSSVTLSKNASDISDWVYSWKEWKELSALDD